MLCKKYNVLKTSGFHKTHTAKKTNEVVHCTKHMCLHINERKVRRFEAKPSGKKSTRKKKMNNEIEEEGEEDGRRGLETVREIQFEGSNSGTVSMNGEDNVYVGVGKGDSSMEALRWALDNLITSSSTLLYLIHVFPETRSIPYPCMYMLPSYHFLSLMKPTFVFELKCMYVCMIFV